MKDILKEYKEFLIDIKNKGFFHLLSANVLIQVFGFGSQFIVAWLLTPTQLGQIRIMQTYASLALLITTFGFTTSTLKLCSEDRPIGEIVFLFKKALKYIIYCILITMPIILICSKMGLISSDPVINGYFPYFSLILIPWSLSSLYSNYLQARKEIKMMANIQTTTRLVSLILVVALTALVKLKGYLFSIFVGNIITFLFLYRKVFLINYKIKKENIKNSFKIHWDYASLSFVTNLIGQISLYLDIFLMNYFISDRTAIGYYSFAITMIIVTNIFTTAVQQIVVPYLSEKSSNIISLKYIYKKYNRINIICSIIISILCLFIIPIIIKMIFGDKYIKSIPFFRILIIAWFFQSAVSFKGYTLWGIGKINYNFYSALLSLLIGFIISYLLMNEFNILGLAYAKMIINFFTLFIVTYFFRKGMKSYEKAFKNL